MKSKHIMYTLVILWALMVVFIAIIISNIWSVSPATDSYSVAGERVYQVDHISYGDLVLFNPEDRTDNFIVPMEQAFPFSLDAMPHDLIAVYVDEQDNIVHMERID